MIYFSTHPQKGMGYLHPGRLTWHLQITHLERKMIFQTSMIMFHVNLQGRTGIICCFVVSERPLLCSQLISMVSASTVRIWSYTFSDFSKKALVSDHPTTPPKKALKQNFTGSKKILQIAHRFFLKQKKPNKKHRGKTLKNQQQKTTTTGRGPLPGGKKPNGFQRWENPPTELRLTLGSFMGLSLGVTRLSLRGTLFLAFRHLTPHLPFLGENFWAFFFVFFLGGREKTWYLNQKIKATSMYWMLTQKKGEIFEMSTSWVDSCRCGWWFLQRFTVLDHFFRQRTSDVTFRRKLLAVLKHIKPSRLSMK